MKKHLFALAALVAFGLTSCEKDKQETPAPQTASQKQNLLRANTWQATYITSEFIWNGVPYYTDVDTADDGTTIVFTANQIISYEGGVAVDTTEYSMISADSLQMDTIRMGIDILTNSQLRLRTKFDSDSAAFPGDAGVYLTLDFIK